MSASTLSKPPLILCSRPITCKDKDCGKKHLCEYGSFCSMMSDETHCHWFLHVCPKGINCLDNTSSHSKMFLHTCKANEKCNIVNNDSHRAIQRHYCNMNSDCTQLHDEVHMIQFMHKCVLGDKCPFLTEVNHGLIGHGYHIDLFNHDPLSPRNTLDSAQSVRPKARPNIHIELQNMEDLSSHQQYDSRATASPRKALTYYGFERVYKSTLTPLVKTWKRAASMDIQFPNDSKTWRFVGWELKDNDHKVLSGNAIFQVNNRFQTLEKSHIQDAIESLNNMQYEQPWFSPEVYGFYHSDVSSAFDRIMNFQTHNPDWDISFRALLDNITGLGIPVFFAGECVKDIVFYTCSKKETDVKEILRKVKEFTLVFGCSGRELRKAVQGKYNVKLKLNANGVVLFGELLPGLVITGKSINGVNNDIYPHRDVPRGIGNDLSREALYRDFTMNCLFYDHVNSVVFDITGVGIMDTINCTLRISVTDNLWEEWAKGNPSKLIQYWKYLSVPGFNYKPADDRMRDFIIGEAKSFKYSEQELRCKKIMKLDIKGKKNDMESKFRENTFRETAEKDLGSEWMEHYFPGKSVQLDTPKSPDEEARLLTGSPDTYSPEDYAQISLDLNARNDIEFRDNIMPFKATFIPSIQGTGRPPTGKDPKSQPKPEQPAEKPEKAMKGRNPATLIFDILFLIFNLGLIIAMIVFGIFEAKDMWKKSKELRVQAQSTVYIFLSVLLLTVGVIFKVRVIIGFCRATTLVSRMKSAYARLVITECILTSLACIIQVINLPVTYPFAPKFYYVRVALYIAAFFSSFGYGVLVVILMWTKDGNKSEKRQRLLRSAILSSMCLHFIANCIVLAFIYLFMFYRAQIFNLLQSEKYDKYKVRAFVLVLLTWIHRGHYYIMILVVWVLPFQGLQLLGFGSVFLKKRWVPHIYRVYSLAVTLLGSVSMALIGVCIYAVCEFFVQNRGLHMAIPIIWSVYCLVIHLLWIVPTILCRCRLFHQVCPV